MRKGWREYQLEEIPLEILDGDRGKNYPKKSEFHRQGHCLFLNANNVTQNGFDFTSDVDFISDEKDKSLRKGKLNRYDVVLTTRGTIGNVAYFGDDIPFEHIRINSGMVILRGNERFFDSYFLYQFFKSSLFRSQIQKLSTGSAVPQLPIRDIKKTRINLPPISEQRRIAAVLKSFDDKIENDRRMNETLEGMAQALFKSWFVDFDPVLDNALAAGNPIPKEFAWRARLRKSTASNRKPLPPEIRSLFPSEFQPSEHGPIPKGWKEGTLGDICIVKGGFAYKSKDLKDKGECGVIKIKNIQQNRTIDTEDIQFVSQRIADTTSEFLLKSGDLLMAMTGATVGKFGLFVNDSDRQYFLNQRVARFSQKEIFKSIWFIYCCILQPGISNDIVNNAGGSAQANISANAIMNTRIIVPDSQLIDIFNTEVNNSFSLFLENRKTECIVNNLRDVLLLKLLSGEIEI